jgi:hypothetical protein
MRMYRCNENCLKVTLTKQSQSVTVVMRELRECSRYPRLEKYSVTVITILCKQLIFNQCVGNLGLPVWSSSQSSWPQIQRSGFDSRRYQIFWELVGLERGPLSLVSAIEELLGRKSDGSGREIREYGQRDPSRWPRGTLYPQKLPPASPKSGFRSVGIVRLRTQATEFNLVF